MPWLITRPRYVQPIAGALCFAGSMLFAFSRGGSGDDYWRFMFPGQSDSLPRLNPLDRR